jgi:low affinity Fe/Cu permease
VVLDKLSQILFVVISVMIMVLSNYWQISVAMAIHLTCFICLCLVISSQLYKRRKLDKKTYKNMNRSDLDLKKV